MAMPPSVTLPIASMPTPGIAVVNTLKRKCINGKVAHR
jgi:hypothetical protein